MAADNPQALKIVSVILKFLGTIPLLIGLGLLIGAVFSGNRQYTILTKWPTDDAEVARSELAHHRETFANGHPATVYQALIDFRYNVDGKEDTGSRSSDYCTSDYAEMKGKVDAYQARITRFAITPRIRMTFTMTRALRLIFYGAVDFPRRGTDVYWRQRVAVLCRAGRRESAQLR